MELSARLETIANFIPPGLSVADIGTDHALLPISLVNRGISPRVIATDLNEKPYQTALRQVQSEQVQNQVEVRKGDGLASIEPGEADVIIIAGMGGNTIVKILDKDQAVLARVKHLVLQPMTDAAALRLWLNQNGWKLVKEELVKEEDRIYLVIAAEPGQEIFEDKFLFEIGPLLLKAGNPILVEYLQKIEDEYKRVLAGLSKSRSAESMKKAIAMTTKLTKLREVINQCRQITG